MDDLPVPLARVKAWIWIHSFLGAALAVAFFHVLLWKMDDRVAFGIVGCGLAWCLGLAPLWNRAEALTPAERVRAKGLPGWFLALCIIAQIGGMPYWGSLRREWMIAGEALLALALLLRGFISTFMDVPMHRKTWTVCLLLVLFGLAGQLFLMVVEAAIAGC